MREKCVNSSKWQKMARCEGEKYKKQKIAIDGML
jgi:hypothetical protein